MAAILALVTVSASGQDWLPAIVRVECGLGIGTGTLVATYEQDGQQGGYVLTARHVVDDGPACVVVWQDGYRSAGLVDAKGDRYDTALIRVRPPAGSPVLPVAEEPAPQGVVVQVFGYGGQYDQPVRSLRLTQGEVKVRGYADYGNEMRIICDPWCMSGDSGGPIIFRGKVVGIISGYSEPRDTRGPHCTPIRNLLRTVLPHGIFAAVDQRRAGYG
jgi:S1-C subfamily serine protease